MLTTRIAGRKGTKKHELSAVEYENTSTVCGQTAPLIAKASTVTSFHGVWKGNKITLSNITVKKVWKNRLIIRISTIIFLTENSWKQHKPVSGAKKDRNNITPAWDSSASSQIWAQTFLTILLKQKFSNRFLKKFECFCNYCFHPDHKEVSEHEGKGLAVLLSKMKTQ